MSKLNNTNYKAVAKYVLGIIGFLLTNISLLDMGKIMKFPYIILMFVCVGFIAYLLAMINSDFQYHKRLSENVEKLNAPLFLCSSYVAHCYNRKISTNPFNVEKTVINYCIIRKKDESKLSVQYEMTVHAGKRKVDKIYFTTLSRPTSQGKIKPQIYINSDAKNEISGKMCSLEKKKNIILWVYDMKNFHIDGDFQFKIILDLPRGYQFGKENYFLIDPKNYGGKVEKICVKMTYADYLKKNADEDMHRPAVVKFKNAMNTENESGIDFEDYRKNKKEEYIEYIYEDEIKPDTQDTIYVIRTKFD